MLPLHIIIAILFELVASLILWEVLLLLIILPLTPIWLPLMFLRQLEKKICEKFLGMERLDKDAAFWMLDNPKNKSNINGVMILHEHFAVSRLQRIIEEKLIRAKTEKGETKYPNITRYIKSCFLDYYWCQDKAFDIGRHVYAWNSNVYQSEEEMLRDLNRIAMRPFLQEDEVSPWEYVLLYYLDEGVTKTCLLLRCHHAITDGISFTNFVVNALGDNVSVQHEFKSVPGYMRMLLRVRGFLSMPRSLLRLLLNRKPGHDLKCNKISGRKYLMWSDPIDMSVVKAIKEKLQVTVNDVVIGCLGTCLRQFLADNKTYIPDEIVSACPVTTRYTLGEAETFANRIAIVFAPIPTKSSNTEVNIKCASERMTEMKYSGEHHGMRYAALLLNYLLPYTFTKVIFRYLSSNADLVFSNVPGPKQPIVLDGSVVESTSFWPPQQYNIGLGASVLSYNGQVRVAFCCDNALKVKPDDLVRRIPGVFHELAETISGTSK